jgi:hypothetical protein
MPILLCHGLRSKVETCFGFILWKELRDMIDGEEHQAFNHKLLAKKVAEI